jgi:branched-chain amino acid transport system permease protein
MVGGIVLGVNSAAMAARAGDVLAALGQHDIGERQGTILTNYELRIVELARAMVASPKVLLLDEPFAGLAVAEIDRLIEALRWTRGQGVSIAIVDHTIPSLRRFVDRMVVLDSGALIADGAPDEVLTDPNVVRAYLGHEEAA